jgi:hypothetical protein
MQFKQFKTVLSPMQCDILNAVNLVAMKLILIPGVCDFCLQMLFLQFLQKCNANRFSTAILTIFFSFAFDERDHFMEWNCANVI